MPRLARIAPGGVIFHCLNRGNARRDLFDDDGDFATFRQRGRPKKEGTGPK